MIQPRAQFEEDEIDEHRIERSLATVAYIVARHGAVYAPIFDRLDRELAAARRRADPVARARRWLEDHTLAGGVKAIR